ncbi:Alpha/Beta hydrolase protein [Crucibulum laeve]|uniref:Alpha/Beta hydrolase protein n=1 Tax=Crucibulum laeve TaxID=68775 RepID=A0A5C3M5H7_9AGAR|nr:Alpha/Beta hydrolase protein [Crucibulum laeve]
MTTAEIPFKIDIPDSKLSLLKQKLALTTFPDELEDAGREYGAPLADIQRLVARWRDGYDWRKHEAELNAELPQFMKDIEVEGFGTLAIHYVHKKSEVEDAIPLLFVHGWPGNFLEVRKILPLLTAASPDHPSFHVVAISMPGYGFSDGPTKKGFRFPQYAEVANKLMLALGYDQYVTQGGDLGFFVTRKIANMYGGKHSKAWHTNFPRLPNSSPPKLFSRPLAYLTHILTPYTEAEKAGLARTDWFEKLGRGYFMEQSTQPQTLGYGLTDSPAGLLAWIYEKLVNWSDDYLWDDDEVLTWVSTYWFSRAGPAASLRIYYEMVQGNERGHEDTSIPLGFSYFPKELFNVPKRWHKASNLVFESEHTAGGHFAAHEKPELLVNDLRAMFGKGGPAFGIVPGKAGYR